ncbi:MAG: hypothetical protein OQJ89_04240 [Kangiellaceae bacterium]|nr:hypothetical protein [Kangiellaceae bacterium]MCW8998794.1 hypothetical protein [Kangiellaceae bacterium]MCW9016151.1 hypothetical protein [Kangiellaceae bacterium]
MSIDNRNEQDGLQANSLSDKEKKSWNRPLLKTFSTQNTEAKDTFNPGEFGDTIGPS